MRLFLLLLVIILCASCKMSVSNEVRDLPNNENTTQQVYFNDELGKYVPTVTLETVGAVNPDVVFLNDETLENNVHTKWAEERLGIRIDYQWTISDTNNAFTNKLRLEMAKGTLPDIVTTRDEYIIQELIDSGQFMEVGDLFNEYASDVWKQAMLEEPSVWDFVTRDGGKFAIPILDYEYSSDPILWIREDWLDKLDLAEPTTFAELENVMHAFVHQDPDGNGEQDTYGLSISFINGPNTWMGDSSWIFGAFGAIPKQWDLKEDDSLSYGSISPSIKDALSLLKSWILKGYISDESQWYDEVRAAQLFTSSKAGIIAGPYWMSGWPLSDLLKTDSQARYKAIAIPEGPDGLILRRGKLPVNGAIFINKKMENPEIFFTYQNYLFDYYALSKGEFKYGLAKDYDWKVENEYSKINPPSIVEGPIRVESYTLTFDGARIPSRVVKAIPEEVAEVLMSQSEYSKKEQYTGPPTITIQTKGELLQKLEQKTFENILFGNDHVNEFDSFVTMWEEYGGKKITLEVNDWYQSMKSKQKE